MGLQAVIYARQSLDRSGEGAAIERQVADCRRLAEMRQWDVVEVLSDNDVSASAGKHRPGYERIIQMMRAESVDVVIVWALDRLTRRLADVAGVIDICKATGVKIATYSGDIDLSTANGRQMAGILASVAQGEVDRKGERQKRANLQRAQNGNVGWTRRPFGYQRVDKVVVVVEAEATALKRAAGHVLAGGTLAGAVRDLDAEGLRTTAGKKWNVTSLRRALLNPRYAGRAVSLGEDHGMGQWPVILDAATQDRLADVLRDVARRVQQGTEVKYLLSGLVRCGRCDAAMFASPMGEKGKRWMVYRCRTAHLARRLDLVDEVVTGIILSRLSQADARALFAPDVNLDALRIEAQELRGRRDDLAEMLADGLLAASAVRKQAKALGERLRAVEAQIDSSSPGDPLAALVTSEDVEATWKGLTIKRQRAVIDAVAVVRILPAGKGIRWAPEQVRIEWRG
ncbi:MAG: recombinase family protein [Nocardioidaceae bacterium]